MVQQKYSENKLAPTNTRKIPEKKMHGFNLISTER